MELNKIRLEQWDPVGDFDDGKPFAMCVSATRNSGKSYLIRHLYKDVWMRKRMFDTTIVFSQTLANDFYADFVNSKLMYESYQPEVLKKTFAEARKMIKYGKVWNVLIILDDCISAKDKYDKQLTSIFTQGRHINISIVYITQKLSYTSTTWINNCNYILILRNVSRGEKRYIAEKILVDPLSHRYDIKVRESAIVNACMKLQDKSTLDRGVLVATPLKLVDPNVDYEKYYEHVLFHYRAPKYVE
ncbi:MAG: ATPase/DNA packaging protein [Promethearchaeota archaeon]